MRDHSNSILAFWCMRTTNRARTAMGNDQHSQTFSMGFCVAVDFSSVFRMNASQIWFQSQESFVLFLLLLFTFVFPYFTLLNPLGQTMLSVKSSLCGGFQEFVVAQHLVRCGGHGRYGCVKDRSSCSRTSS